MRFSQRRALSPRLVLLDCVLSVANLALAACAGAHDLQVLRTIKEDFAEGDIRFDVWWSLGPPI